ncbi:unnamed protein product [Periconia digitata]|uniref:Uncharacterized protein n=1 Tax=Periconia digitata TaxID=1303443 RepID=A0A9W4UEB2_9PLEO|nr:unnamed protein product [Periconia digitata]
MRACICAVVRVCMGGCYCRYAAPSLTNCTTALQLLSQAYIRGNLRALLHEKKKVLLIPSPDLILAALAFSRLVLLHSMTIW